MKMVRNAFPDCECYEINLISYLWTSQNLRYESNRRWYQISAGEDIWPDFRDNNWVYHDGQGDKHWRVEDEISTGLEQDCLYGEPSPGDVVLVRSGRQQGRGIGIVYRNDYGKQPDRNGRIHVLWVNKKQAPLAASMPASRFSRVGLSSLLYEAFAKSDAYSATMKLQTMKLHAPPPTAVHPLNQILCGPPGTGKTYSATKKAEAIVMGIEEREVTEENRNKFANLRFDPKTGQGQIAMVTFHQSFSYEDFVEGIRPRLDEVGEIGYELRSGIFKKIVKAAETNPGRRYVLIIDEINRGNIPKILGELITLIEPSRRLGKKAETTVMLPHSEEDFGVPDNLHIIGTMNTADRSILPIDTALRRRFVYEEMMPEPKRIQPDSVAGIDLQEMLRAINERISLLLDREHQIGHTYLFDVKDVKSLAYKFQKAIFPLLAEYFYDDWSKIRHVLGKAAFVKKRDSAYRSSLAEKDVLDPDTAIYEVLPATDKEWEDPVQYRRIYDESLSVSGDQREDENSGAGDDQS